MICMSKKEITREQFEQHMGKQLKKVIHQVWQLLKAEPEYRNNDTLLQVSWAENFAGVETMDDLRTAAAFQAISFESIRRARQKIQEKGFFLPTDETVIKRRKLQKVYEQFAGDQPDQANVIPLPERGIVTKPGLSGVGKVDERDNEIVAKLDNEIVAKLDRMDIIEDLTKKGKSDLEQMARALNIAYFTHMTKTELIQAIMDPDAADRISKVAKDRKKSRGVVTQ
jgi:hypothetical protein